MTEVATEIGVHKSTASRLLAALAGRGLVEQAGERGRYRLGPASCGWPAPWPAGWTSPARARRSVSELAASSARRSMSRVRQATSRSTCTRRRRPAAVTATAGSAGRRRCTRPRPARCCSPIATRRSAGPASSAELPAFTRRHGHRPGACSMPSSTAADATGYATTVGELEDGLNAVAAPIRGPTARWWPRCRSPGPATG